MRVQNNPRSIFNDALIIKVSIGHPGNSAKLDSDQYDVKSGSETETAEAKAKAKARTSATKKLLEAPEIDAAASDLEKTRASIRKISNRSPLGEGSRLLRIVAVPKVEEIVRLARERLDENHKPRISELYPQRIAEAKRDLNGLFDPTNYAPLEEFLAKFYIDTLYLTFDAPESLASTGLLEREQGKIDQRTLESVEAVPVTLAREMQKLSQDLIARTAKSASGARTQFKGLLDNYLEWLDTLPLRNILDTEELTAAALKATQVLGGLDSETLINNASVRTYVADEMKGITTTLDTLINLRPTRAFEAA